MPSSTFFASSGNFSTPNGVRWLFVQCVGGGAAGGAATNNPGQGGGGAGGCFAASSIKTGPGSGYVYVAGAVATGTNSTSGVAGNDSGFGVTLVIAKGGFRGGQLNTADNVGGGTSSIAGCSGQIIFVGGSGGHRKGTASGPGGGGAGITGAGMSASSGVFVGSGTLPGGDGGVGVLSTSAGGGSGASPGGGGGGGRAGSAANQLGGHGGAGMVAIRWLPNNCGMLLGVGV
jgi:hypothetical protein